MARMSSDTRHILIGAATCVAIALFFAVGYSGNPAKREGNGYRLIGIYEDATGLNPGSPVLMAGLKVGAVRTLLLEKQTNEAVVQMTIEDGYEIPIDSEAKIISNGLAGGKYIRIVPGGDLTMMQPGETFQYVRGSIDFLTLFERIVKSGEAKQAEMKKGDSETTPSPSN
ncbi:MAG: MlaD family protein [Alphaproteobacteria bacterium]|nr:MlaD family protein [Alphaproteobacteria bacterium]